MPGEPPELRKRVRFPNHPQIKKAALYGTGCQDMELSVRQGLCSYASAILMFASAL